MNKKIFDEFGFLTSEGKVFVNDGFIKELKRVLLTASNYSDVLIISCILKSLIGEYAFERCKQLKDLQVEQTPAPQPIEPIKTKPILNESTLPIKEKQILDLPPIE